MTDEQHSVWKQLWEVLTLIPTQLHLPTFNYCLSEQLLERSHKGEILALLVSCWSWSFKQSSLVSVRLLIPWFRAFSVYFFCSFVSEGWTFLWAVWERLTESVQTGHSWALSQSAANNVLLLLEVSKPSKERYVKQDSLDQTLPRPCVYAARA